MTKKTIGDRIAPIMKMKGKIKRTGLSLIRLGKIFKMKKYG